MADIYFKCACGKSLAVDEKGVGATVLCVDCGQPVKVPEFKIQFTCERCQATLLAAAAISGDRIKCTICGWRMSVPEAAVDHNQAGIPAGSSTAGLCGDTLGRALSEFQARRRPLPEPASSGIAWRQPVCLMFRLALLVSALAVGAELAQWFISARRAEMSGQKRPPAAQTVGLIEVGAELAHARSDQPAVITAELAAKPIDETPVFSATTGLVETPPVVPELAAVEPARNSNVIQVAMSSVTPARDRQTTLAKPARTSADASEVENVIHPAQPLLDEYKVAEKARQLESGRQKKHSLDSRNQAVAKNALVYTPTQPVGGWVELKKRVPALQEVVSESQKLNALINS